MTLDNKMMAGGTFGDSDPMFPSVEKDNAADRAADGAGIPQTGSFNDNKFPVNTSYGDSEPNNHSTNDQPMDRAHDTAGFNNPDLGEQTPMDMGLEGNKFPRETGHDSLSPEEAQLS